VATLEALLVRYLKNGNGTINQTTLGRLAGAKCRAADHCQHGRCPSKWCGYCVTLELRARGLSVAWTGLSRTQFREKAKAGYPMSVSIRYAYIPKVSKASYSRTVPARGRSDDYLGGHQVVVWGVTRNRDGTIKQYIVSDPDFGSKSRPVIPPYSLIARDRLEAAREHLRSPSGRLYGVAVMGKRPPKLT
jgi:hypothetical protein